MNREMESRIDPRMQFILVGDEIFIRRSNRKTFQKAEVVSVTPKHGFVNVEWRDNDGNLWGREVTIGDVIELNPHLVVRTPEITHGSKSSVVSYPEQNEAMTDQLNNDERRTTPSNSLEAGVSNKAWLEDVKARLTEARARGTTLPKNPFLSDRYFRSSESENGDDEDQSGESEGTPETKRKSTMQMIGEASQFFKNMLSGGPHEETTNLEASESQEKLSIYYDDIHSPHSHTNDSTQYVSFQPRTLEDPFYSPLMEEMYAPHAIHGKETRTLESLPQKRCTNFNSRTNEARSYTLQSKYSPTAKNHNASNCKMNAGKPSTNNVIMSPKRKSDSVQLYNRPASTNPFTSHASNTRTRPPTADPNIGSKSTNNSHHLVSPSTASVRPKHSVVESIQRLEREREQRRRKQEAKRAEENALRMKDPGNINWKLSLMVNEYRQQILCDPLKLTDPVKHSRIIVCIRKRPLNAKEIEAKQIDVITIPNKDLVLVHEPKAKLDLTKYLENHAFRFDYAFDENSTNEMVYKFTTKPLIDTIFEGGTATVFAYGQTGSGKTHTMGGNFINGTKQESNNGIYMNVANDIINMLSLREYEELGLRLSVTFFEIYKGRLYDLLAGRNEIKVMEDVDQQIQIVGLTELYANGLDEVVSLIRRGNASRTSGKTAINPMSSRSHSVFQLILRQDPGENHRGQIYGKFSLIDLAGNERGVGRGMQVDRHLEIEGAEINKSLLALKECIRALARSEGHIPFRGSKLTLVLKDTFMNANSRVCMIGTVSPGHGSCNCSLNTILYANRVKEFNAHDPVNDDMANSGKQ